MVQLVGMFGVPNVGGLPFGQAGAEAWSGGVATAFEGGSGTESDPWQIQTPEQLAYLAQTVNDGTSTYYGEYLELTDNIDLSGHNWTPIGIGNRPNNIPSANYFDGTFDGGGHEVAGMSLVSSDAGAGNSYFGLFGFVSGDISDLGVTGFVVSVDKTSGRVLFAGGLAGYVHYGDVADSYAEGSLSARRAVSFSLFAGGIVGQVNGAKITGSHAAVDVDASSDGGSSAGGLVGVNQAGSAITGSYAVGGVSSFSANAASDAGGLVGSNINAAITGSYAAGDVSSSAPASYSYAGGLAGYSGGSAITDSYAMGDVEATQILNPTNAYAGGLVGYFTDTDTVLRTSYAWGEVSATAGASPGGLVGFVGSSVSADRVKSNDWRQDTSAGGVNDGLNVGIGSDGTALIAQGVHAASRDVEAFTIENIGYFRDTQGWNFENIWCYTRGDDGKRPQLRALVDAADIIDNPDVYRSADIRAMSADIDGTVYTWQQQDDETTWVCDAVSADADLSSVDLNVLLWPGASVDKTAGHDLTRSVDLTVTAPDGTTTRKHTVLTHREDPDNPDVPDIILDALPGNSRAVLTLQDDSSYAVDIYIPFDVSFDPSEIESIYVEAVNITIVRLHWLDENGDITDIPHRQAGTHELHIEGTVANRHTLADVVIKNIYVRLKSDPATRHVQELNMNLSAIPGGTPDDPDDPDDPHSGSGGVGCSTGAGAFALIGLGVALIRRRKL